MMISQIQVPHAYSRRLVVSLGIALVLHGALLLIPIYRWLGTTPGDSGGAGAGKRPFAGTLLGAAVVIRAPETPDRNDTSSPEAGIPADATSSQPAPLQLAEDSDRFDESVLAVDVMPPQRSATASGTENGNAEGGVLSGSLQPLGGGGGVQIEMDLIAVVAKHPAPLGEIVLKRKIDDQVIVQVLVDYDGYVVDHRVLRSIPRCPECTASVVEAALASVFPPPTYEGERVQAWVTVSWLFSYTR